MLRSELGLGMQEAWVPVLTRLHTCWVAVGRLSTGFLRLGFSICKMELRVAPHGGEVGIRGIMFSGAHPVPQRAECWDVPSSADSDCVGRSLAPGTSPCHVEPLLLPLAGQRAKVPVSLAASLYSLHLHI